MSQRSPESDGPPPEEERLSRTLLGSLQNLGNSLGGVSTGLALGGAGGLVLGLILLALASDLRLYGYIVLAIAGGLLVISVIISFGTASRALTGRRGRYSTNTVVMVIAFIGIAAAVNFLAFDNPARVDVTATKQFSLAPRTIDVLKNLEQPVEARGFFVPGRSAEEELQLEALRSQMDDLLHEFEVRSGKFSYEFIDPEVDPGTAREFQVTRNGTVVFQSIDPETDNPRRHHIAPSAFLEQEFVTGLLIVTGEEQKRVYFLEGHGERNINDSTPDADGFGYAFTGLVGENYIVSPISLISNGKEILEEDRQEGRVNMLVVAGPRTDLLADEVQVLDDYLKGGGRMLFLVEPDTPPTFRDFLARWGIVVGEGHILDRQRSLGDNMEITFLSRDQYFSILPEPFQSVLNVDQLTSRLDTVYYPGLTSLSPAEEGVAFLPPKVEEVPEEEAEEKERSSIVGTALAFTSPDSWLINDPSRNVPEEGDPQGPFFPAVAFKALSPLDEEPPADPSQMTPASLVVFGDTDFVSNRYFYAADNGNFFLNSINWLVGDIPLANIRPKPFSFRALVLTSNEFDFMRFSSWLLLPILMALTGGFVWWRRR